jgi:hypothetical protein
LGTIKRGKKNERLDKKTSGWIWGSFGFWILDWGLAVRLGAGGTGSQKDQDIILKIGRISVGVTQSLADTMLDRNFIFLLVFDKYL